MLGAIIGDSVGSKYEFNNIKTKDFEITQNDFEATDDTIMTLAVCDILQRHVANNRDEVIDTIRKWARAYPNAGYGGRFSTGHCIAIRENPITVVETARQ